MVVILATPLIFERFKLPGLISPIVAGVVLGTSVLNVLERGQAIELLGNVGLLYIMFLSGLGINLSQFRKTRDRSSKASLLACALGGGAGWGRFETVSNGKDGIKSSECGPFRRNPGIRFS